MRFVLGRDSFDIGRPGIDSSSPPCEPDECTIVRRNGEVCGQPVCDDTSVSVCDHHAWKIYHQLDTSLIRESVSRPGVHPSPPLSLDPKKEAHRRAASVVYYARNRGTIKIGRTTNLRQRMETIRIDHAMVLAIEPGAYEVESRRLKQFEHLRFGRREDFEIGDDLIQHIKAIREKYGPPSFEQDPFGLVARLNAG